VKPQAGAQKAMRVGGLAIDPHLEMQMRARRASG
jgi:hypothetical protein